MSSLFYFIKVKKEDYFRRVKYKIHQQRWFAFTVGFLFGIFLTENILAAAILGLLGLAIQFNLGLKFSTDQTEERKNASFLEVEEQHLRSIIALASIVIKADGNVSQSQLNLIEVKLSKEYPNYHVQHLMRLLRAQLNTPTKFHPHTVIVAESFTIGSKIQLMHFLIGIAIVDTMLADAELKCLREISKRIELNLRTFNGILAMFRFRYEHQQQEKNWTKGASKRMLDAAYEMLEIEMTVTDEAVKKAYRKMAVKHHPDKVTHLGEEFRKAANDKFQLIVAAYDLIQKERKFV